MNKTETIDTLMCKDERAKRIAKMLKQQSAKLPVPKKEIKINTKVPIMAMCGD